MTLTNGDNERAKYWKDGQTRMSEELIVLLSEDGQEIGSAPKLASHHANTPLHKAFSCYIFDGNGLLLVTKRAKTKKVWPGVWTNSACGHPAPKESFEDAITRRSQFELGATIRDIKILLPDFRYKTPPYNGIVENEICPVFIAQIDGDFQPNQEEVEGYEWVTWKDFLKAIESEPSKYSYWCKKQAEQLKNHRLILEMTQL